MNENQGRQSSMVETTDCLEAVGVLRRWKNLMFTIILLCLLLLQASFWLVNVGYVRVDEASPGDSAAVTTGDADAAAETTTSDETQGEAPTSGPGLLPGLPNGLTFDLLARIVQFVNGLLILAVMLYSLTLLISLMASLIGRLGGISHVCRAFFLSLIMVVLIVPWQKLSGFAIVGVTYTPDELLRCVTSKSDDVFGIGLYYLRFCGYWLFVLLLLFMSQLRTARWTNSILRRLEII
ncbi:MAG: hypothetical protein JSU70_03805 [Phycisphaerales bacterium]|nr:MAG: hypothetical protein JSU70_03805 [Phycisphaerales bacterium]